MMMRNLSVLNRYLSVLNDVQKPLYLSSVQGLMTTNPLCSELPKLVAPTAEALTAAAGFRDLPANRRSKMNNHLATVCEGIPALGWVLQVWILLLFGRV